MLTRRVTPDLSLAGKGMVLCSRPLRFLYAFVVSTLQPPCSNHLMRNLSVFGYIAVVVLILKAQRDDFADLVVVDGSLGTVLVSLAAESAETVRWSLRLKRVEFDGSEESDNTPAPKGNVDVSPAPDSGLLGSGAKAAAVVWHALEGLAGSASERAGTKPQRASRPARPG